jgi:hypothetical protein
LSSSGGKAGGIHAGERRFALALTVPGLLVLLLTTTFPLLYLIWSSFQTINLAMPFMDGFAGVDNYIQMWGDSRFWHSLKLTAIYTTSSVTLQILIGLGLALLVMQIPAGQWIFRIVAILPIVLAPVVVGLFWRTLMLSPNFGTGELARRAHASAHLGDRHSHLAVDTVRLPGAAREPRLATPGRLRGGSDRSRKCDPTLLAYHAAPAAPGNRHRGDYPGDDLAGRLRRHLRRHRRRAGHGE